MVDLTSIVAALSAVEQGLNILKTLRGVNFELEKSELKLQMAEVMSALADAKIGLTSSREQIADLEKEIARLTAFAAKRLRIVGGMYLEIDNDDKVVDGPFCSRCHDVDKKFVRVVETPIGQRGMGHCPQCKTPYKLWEVQGMLPKAGK